MRVSLGSERIYLRDYNSNDVQDLYEFLSIDEVVKYEPYSAMSFGECKKEVKRRMNDPSFYAVILRENEKMIGNIYFEQTQPYKFRTYELGYVFNPKYWNMGYATEAASIILRYGFSSLNAHRIIANCNQLNDRSIKLLERIGMRRESSSKDDIYFHCTKDGEPLWQSSYMYAILNDEYMTR